MSRNPIDYLRQLQSLLPFGKVWPRETTARLTEFLYAEADELARVEDRSGVLVTEKSTKTTIELLTDHEAELGLPDECTIDADLTKVERRVAANAKLTAIGQQNKEYFIDIAAAYGYVATITEYTPFWCGVGGAGDPIGDQDSLFNWKLSIFTSENPLPFLCGLGGAGDSLNKVSDLPTTIFCFADKYKPAHTRLIRELTGDGFDKGFDTGFDSLPSDLELTGAFGRGFSSGFEVRLGGAFNRGFSTGFDKPA